MDRLLASAFCHTAITGATAGDRLEVYEIVRAMRRSSPWTNRDLPIERGLFALPPLQEELRYVVAIGGRSLTKQLRPLTSSSEMAHRERHSGTKVTARRSSLNSTTTLTIHGRPEAVCEHWPALCASSLAERFDVSPV